MEIKSTDLISLFEQSLAGEPAKNLLETGVVVQIGDNVCQVHGLDNAVYGELIEFEGGNKGIIFGLNEYAVSIFLLYTTIAVKELEVAQRTGTVFKTPVGKQLIGRCINALGKPLDALGDLNPEAYHPIEVTIPGIIERSPINESLETGITVIDALIPVGKGQRELIIGNRGTGKSAIALDAILHQKGKNVYCIYVSIGQRQANLARTIKLLQEHDALSYTTVISADAGETVLNQYLAPYVGCTIAEQLQKQGHDVLIVYDDLSNHAVAFREMSLLLRRSPGREAYPGDVFYLHSRLLERAGKLINGGSITAFPIVQVQSDDITAYIPTNLISITDGQIFLDTQLFNNGIRPAINVELSVSRVGGAAQTPAIKKVTKALRLELAQYNELLAFSQFGTELDEISQRKLARGSLAVELLKQQQFVTYSFVDQVIMLFALKENFLDSIGQKHARDFAKQLISYIRATHNQLYTAILTSQQLDDANYTALREAIKEFMQIYVPKEE